MGPRKTPDINLSREAALHPARTMFLQHSARPGLSARPPARRPAAPRHVVWIGIRPARREPLLPVAAAGMDPETGLDGDHYRSGTSRTRQVTLIQSEHLGAIAGYLGLERVEPERLRRNVVTSGINLLALKGRTFRLGTALLLCTGECHPCSRMEAELGTGGYNAVRGHGGITARVPASGPGPPGRRDRTGRRAGLIALRATAVPSPAAGRTPRSSCRPEWRPSGSSPPAPPAENRARSCPVR